MDSRNLAEQFIEALHTLEQGSPEDTAALVELYSEQATLTNAALQLTGKQYQGREGAAQFWREYRATFRDIRSEFAQITTNDTGAGLFWTSTGTDTNGQPTEYSGVSLLVFDADGRIATFQGYYDTRQLSRQVEAGA